ncbi:MAG: cyclic nucleotide-binding domain-containing protein [Desulfobulbaceae bacterium]|nr:cyclic nucleotide-binding domain-containing protein [Desulfobulbaceae bacterium]
MGQQQLSGLQEALNSLAKGQHDVLLDPAVTKILPATIMRLAENQKLPAVDALLAQISVASRAFDKQLRPAAATCFIATATMLADARHWQRLEKITSGLKTIVDSPVYREEIRSGAKTLLSRIDSGRSGGQPAAPSQDPAPKTPLAIREQQIFQLAEAGNTEVAKKQLYDLVVSCARKKDFANAERLRERIYEIDPMALMEIIQSGEIIDQEKSEAISEDDLEVWSKLRNALTFDEFNALYYSMEERTYKPEEAIVTQGARNDELFFINMGSVRVSYMGGEKELFLKNLNTGQIAGENFFNASVWTVSLTAMQLTKILALKREKLTELEKQNPGIESKLRDYYGRSSDIHKMLELKGMDRRVHDRHKLERRIQLQVVDDRDRVLSSFRGEMTDISLGGYSFIIRITKKENSRLLLGRSIKAGIPVNGLPDKILRGTVIGVQNVDLIVSDYSVHVKFTSELDRQALQVIMGV